MKFLLIKKCDRCLKRGKHKRFFVGTIQPYEYNGFDLCLNCEKELSDLLINFLNSDGESVVIAKEQQQQRKVFKDNSTPKFNDNDKNDK